MDIIIIRKTYLCKFSFICKGFIYKNVPKLNSYTWLLKYTNTQIHAHRVPGLFFHGGNHYNFLNQIFFNVFPFGLIILNNTFIFFYFVCLFCNFRCYLMTAKLGHSFLPLFIYLFVYFCYFL